ncbi:DNA-binding response regulator [Chryseotalea sanaruensis]|uniref:DNA-binding response regulator n=1 Tax=Chryseotalea sanaruensis TaxID=2482724 RepID=A0A401U7D8_9BACT|nr:response regulator transcription factor [Chryseotalea sanaruensis]GCC50798.1 DNA-binding response regulator [Chryseotalea sanaruensis]
MSAALKIFLVDDHKLVRDGVRAMLLGNIGFKVVGAAGNADEFFSQMDEANPDICVLDVQLPGKSGMEIAETLKSKHPKIKILILTALKDDAPVKQCRDIGVDGMISKDSGKDTYLEALEALKAGRTFYAGQFTELLLKASQGKSDAMASLSDRELDFVRAFAKGLSHKEIADQLNISPRTVEVHKKNVMDKLKFGNDVDLIKFAIREGLSTL